MFVIDTADGSFKLCNFETEHTIALDAGAQYDPASALVVTSGKDAGIVWYLDETTRTLKTQINNLCIHPPRGSGTVAGLVA